MYNNAKRDVDEFRSKVETSELWVYKPDRITTTGDDDGIALSEVAVPKKKPSLVSQKSITESIAETNGIGTSDNGRQESVSKISIVRKT